MKGKFFLLPFVALVLCMVSCSEPQCDSLVGCWSSKRLSPDMWTVYHLKADGTGRVETYTVDACFNEKEFFWKYTAEELLLKYGDISVDRFYYCLDDVILYLYDSEREYVGSYHKKRDCH